MNTFKDCKHCLKYHPATREYFYFYNNKPKQCKIRSKFISDVKYNKSKNKIRKEQKKYYEKNSESLKLKQKEYYNVNRDSIKLKRVLCKN